MVFYLKNRMVTNAPFIHSSPLKAIRSFLPHQWQPYLEVSSAYPKADVTVFLLDFSAASPF